LTPINFTRRHHTSGGGGGGGRGGGGGGGGGGSSGVILVDSGLTTGQPGDTRRHIALFYGGNVAAVPQGELGDPLRRIEAVHLKQLSSRHQVKLLHVKKYLCVHMHTHILADGPTPKKHTHKIGQKHRTPSEKEKKERQKCSNFYTFFTSTLKEITALEHVAFHNQIQCRWPAT
jgi:hypothetical protein